MTDFRRQIERAFVAWGHRVYRRAWLVIVVMLVGVAALATQLPKTTIDTSSEGFFHESDPVRVTYDAFRERFGSDTMILVAIRADDVFELGFLEKLRAFHAEVEREVPMLVEVTSLVNARETRGEGDELIVGELMEDWPTGPAELAAIERRARANPLYESFLLSKDGRFTTVVIETEAYSSLGAAAGELSGFDEGGDEAAADVPFITGEEHALIVEALLAVIERHEGPGFEMHVTGTPVLTDQLQKAMRADMSRFTVLAVGTIAIFLALLFRRAEGVVLPLVTVILSLVSTLAIMAASGTPLTMPTQILPSFLLAVGVGGSVHILAIFYQARRRGEDVEASLAHALGHSGLAVVMTSLTTAGGLLSFVAAELRPIAHFGIFAPIGVMVALVFTLVLLPALISIFPMRSAASRGSGPVVSQRLLLRAGDFAVRRPGPVIAVWGALLLVAVVGASRVPFSHSPWEWFPEQHPLRLANELVNDELDGSMFLELLVETREPRGLHEPEMLRRIDSLAAEARTARTDTLRVGKTTSLVDVVKEIHQALNENRPAFHAIPAERPLVAQELLLFENAGSDDLEDFVDPEFRTGRLTIKVPFEDAMAYPPLLDQIRDSATRILGEQAGFELTGMAVVVTQTLNAVMHTMVRSYLIAFAVITPLMVLLIGSVRIGLTAMIPNLTPIVLTLGLMGWAKIPLDAFTLLIGSIAIGLAVDDTIHFMHNFRRYYEESGDVRKAVRDTLATTGQALLFTTLVLSTGFFLFTMATMQTVFHFGLLTGLTILTAFLADLLLAPALLVLVARPRRADTKSAIMTEAIR